MNDLTKDLYDSILEKWANLKVEERKYYAKYRAGYGFEYHDYGREKSKEIEQLEKMLEDLEEQM